MPYVTVDVEIDTDEVLESLSIKELEKALSNKREQLRKKDHAIGSTPPMTSFEARVSLDNASMQLRKQGRNDLAFRLDEIRTDFFQ